MVHASTINRSADKKDSFMSEHIVEGYAWHEHTRDTRISLGSPPAEMNEKTMGCSLPLNPFLFAQSYTRWTTDYLRGIIAGSFTRCDRFKSSCARKLNHRHRQWYFRAIANSYKASMCRSSAYTILFDCKEARWVSLYNSTIHNDVTYTISMIWINRFWFIFYK